MSEQAVGGYFTCNADKSAHDFTIYLIGKPGEDTVTLAPRYKNAESNHLYEQIMDANDLRSFGEFCISIANLMQAGNETKSLG